MKCQNAENVLESMHESKSVAHKGSKVSCKIKGEMPFWILIETDFVCKVKGNVAGIWAIDDSDLCFMFFIFIGVRGWVRMAGASHMRQKNHSGACQTPGHFKGSRKKSPDAPAHIVKRNVETYNALLNWIGQRCIRCKCRLYSHHSR